ncbi:MAG: 1-deoxy-D-xylulose-5-phosphate synthase [Spirochaetia bacterium]
MPHREILPSIHSPEDVKKLSDEQLYVLSSEIRSRIVSVVSKNGGHLASNLGAVELTIALHRVFSSPKDAIVWDVGHQCYTHKLLTGRNELFDSIRRYNGISGFPKLEESPHDPVNTGHSSTSISAGLGINIGRKLKHTSGKVIAVIGDGALTGGMALEALNHAGHVRNDLIIVVNDNKMSISENVGAMSRYLSRITTTKLYQNLRQKVDRSIRRIPGFGNWLYYAVNRIKKSVKALFFKETLFSDLGFEYVGPIDGHNLRTLQHVFENVKELNSPVVVHVHTQKGKGYSHAEGDPATYHGVSPFSVIDGKIERKQVLTYTESYSDTIVDLAEKDNRIVAITAAMEKGTGLSPFKRAYPERFYDVGITEQHAVTLASGLSHEGLKPFVAIYSTFMQRAVDQILHDVAIPNRNVVFCIDRAGIVPGDGETHQGVFDVPLLRCVPNLKILAPYTNMEMKQMAEYALDNSGPFAVRYAKAACPEEGLYKEVPLAVGRGTHLIQNKSQILLVSYGALLTELVSAAQELSYAGIEADVYNLRFLKPIDDAHLFSVFQSYGHVFFFEDSAENGGIGEYLASRVMKTSANIKYSYKGVPDTFLPHGTRKELFQYCGLDSKSIVKDIYEKFAYNHKPVISKHSSRKPAKWN